ncbi:MAG: CPBP family intramembrane glutamic endopeptidase [Promethearchaeota archaeon]
MNNKEARDINKEQDFTDIKNIMELHNSDWSYCPICGNEILKIQNITFCTKCGTNLKYIQQYKRLPPRKLTNPYIQPTQYPQLHTDVIFYETKKISDEEIINTKNHELWGTMVSVGVPLGAFLLMNFLTAGVVAIIIYFSFNLELVFDFLLNPYFLIFSSFFELIFILVPVFYVKRYLQNPTLENRLGLLGFTLKGFNRKGIIKEILIGLGFAVVGVLLVAIVAFSTEILLEFFFGIEIVRDLSSITSDVEIIISRADIFSLILLSIMMVLVIGTSEEILFRGFMQKGLTRSLGNKLGIIITALIFTLIHVFGIFFLDLSDPLIILISFLLSFIPFFAISLMLGLIYYWRKENLIAVIITHGVYDALTIIFAYIFYYGF